MVTGVERQGMTAPTLERSDERPGMVEVPGGRVWYRIAGDGNATPLLTLHGGPGVPSAYLSSLAGLAGERPVIFYDQLGCGNSERPGDRSLWTTERFVAELAAVVAALGLTRFHLLGQSWGTMLAVDYALTQPTGLVSLILASPALSIPRWMTDAKRLIQDLPADTQASIERHEAAGTTGDPDYQAAKDMYYGRHVCRLRPIPAGYAQAIATTGHDVYETMWGPSEFCATGTLLDYDRTDRLGEIAVPTLFTCGRFDEATPEATAWYASLIPGALVAVFEQSAHMPHLEEEEAYLATVGAFLRDVDETQPY
jgi:proline iminopeptidase